MRMILDGWAGEQRAGSGRSRGRLAGVNAPLPLAFGLRRGESDAVGASTVPKDRAPQLASTVVGEDHPGINVGVGVGGTRTNEGDLDLTPLRCGLGFH